MTQTARFLFDRSFDSDAPAGGLGARDRKRLADLERRLADADSAGYARGREEGERDARAALEGQLAHAAAALAEAADRMAGEMGRECEAIRGLAVQAAMAVAERLSRELVRRQPLNEIEALFAECVGQATQAPQITVRVSASLAEGIEARIAAVAAERGFTGQVQVAGDPAISPGDCRIEWDDGGMVRSFEDIRRNIAGAVHRHLAAGETMARPGAAFPGGEAIEGEAS